MKVTLTPNCPVPQRADSDAAVSLQKIETFDFLRVIGAILVFLNHVWHIFPFKIPDVGARGVELFITMSGFLLAYNYYDKEFELSLKNNAIFAFRRMKKFYCLHVLTFLAFAVIQVKDYISSGTAAQVKTFAMNAVANLTLTQSWIPIQDYYWGFNGVSWFLSSLFFCYFCFPFLLRLIKKIRIPLTIAIGGSFFLLNLIQTVYIARNGWNIEYVFYIFPAWKSLEFFVGMLCGAWVRLNYNKETGESGRGNSRLIFFAFVMYVAAIFLCDGLWNRVTFTFTSAILLLVFSCFDVKNSKLFSHKIVKKLSKMSFDFYLIHHVVVIYYGRYSWILLRGHEVSWLDNILIILIISILLSFFYQKIHGRIWRAICKIRLK